MAMKTLRENFFTITERWGDSIQEERFFSDIARDTNHILGKIGLELVGDPEGTLWPKLEEEVSSGTKLNLSATELESVDYSVTTKASAEVYLHYVADGWTAMADNNSTLFINPECGFEVEYCTLKWAETAGYVFTRDDDDDSVYAMAFLDIEDESVPATIRAKWREMSNLGRGMSM